MKNSLCSAEVKERVELYLYSPSGPSWPVIGRNFLLYSVHKDMYTRNELVCSGKTE